MTKEPSLSKDAEELRKKADDAKQLVYQQRAKKAAVKKKYRFL